MLPGSPPTVERETWSNAPQRIPPGRVALVEPIGLAVHDWSRPRPGRPRMFDQDFFEWFSHIHPASLIVVYVPASAFFVWLGLAHGMSVGLSAVLFGVGLFSWTFLEYLIHRFSFHYTPRGRVGMFYAYMIHGVHHAFPEDDRRWLVPPVISVAISAVICLFLRWLFPVTYPPGLAGGLAGYLVYDLSHYLMHRGPSRFEFFNRLRRRHMQHHYATPERWFGVSTSLWDYVFGTTVPTSPPRHS
jgi:sterol desaturase/sphingolipid hydroxylase (fatty acid hydroxylase superfamily)